MSGAHRIHHDLYRGPKVLADPGNAGTIRVTQDLQICEMTSETAETRVVDRPTKSGIRFVLRLYDDGGDVTVTVTGGMNVDGDTKATYADDGDFLSFVSVRASATTYRWQILEGNIGTVVASATESHTPSATVSHTPSHTASHTASHTPSTSPSHTASHTPSRTPSTT